MIANFLGPYLLALTVCRTPQRATLTLLLAGLIAAGWLLYVMWSDMSQVERRDQSVRDLEQRHRAKLSEMREKQIHELCEIIYSAEYKNFYVPSLGMRFLELAELVRRDKPWSARYAFRRAMDAGLSPELRDYARGRLALINSSRTVYSLHEFIFDVDQRWDEILPVRPRAASVVGVGVEVASVVSDSATNNDQRPETPGFSIQVLNPFRVMMRVNTDVVDEPSSEADDDDDAISVISDFEYQPENVHSHGAQAMICDVVDKLRELVKLAEGESHEGVCHEVYSEVLAKQERADLSDKEKEVWGKAMRTLHVIMSPEGKKTHPRQGCSEQEILALVYRRLQQLGEVTDPIEILGQQLADNFDPTDRENEQFCPSGRFARIVSTLNGIDEAIPVIKTTEMILQELNDKVPKLRDEFMRAHVASELRERYSQWDGEAPDDALEAIQNLLREHVYHVCRKDYPHVKDEIFDEWMQSYLDNL